MVRAIGPRAPRASGAARCGTGRALEIDHTAPPLVFNALAFASETGTARCSRARGAMTARSR
jgi:hypothetical protein